MKKLFFFLFAFSSCLFITYSELDYLVIAQGAPLPRVQAPRLPPDRVPERTNGQVSNTNIECNNISIDANDICIITNSLSSSDKELLRDLIEKVFKKNVIYQEIN